MLLNRKAAQILLECKFISKYKSKIAENPMCIGLYGSMNKRMEMNVLIM